jgi:hypothetical protein
MKLDKDPFPTNMNMVELEGKKVLVWPSQAEMTKGKEVVIAEERPPRMIKPKNPKEGQWQKNKGGGASYNIAQRSPLTSSWPSTRKAGPASGVQKPDHLESQTGQSDFPESGQQLGSRELIRQTILDSTVPKVRRSRLSSTIVSFDALLPGRATNA